MKAKVLFVLLFLFLPVAFAQRYELTNYNATIWQNPYFLNLGIGNKYLFTSTYYLNETRYFLFSYDSYYIRIINRRLDSFGNIEDTRYYAPGISGCANYDFSQDINLWYKDQWLFLFNGLGLCNYLSLIKFNVTDYVTNSSSSGLSHFIIATNVVSDGNLFSIGSIMSKGYYTDMVANMSFPIIYKTTDEKIYIAYDFYDLENAAFTPSNMKTIEISTGMSNVKKLYVIPTHGNCFQWSNCLFHVLYEGSSSQNGNRYGIYVREVRRGFFGYEFADRGIMCLAGDALGFQDCVVGTIDKWFYTQSFPSLANRIYYRVITSDNRRIVFVQQYDIPTWVKIDEQVINYHDNNALVPYALGFGRFTTSGTYNFTNITIKNNANVAYIGGLGYTGVSSYYYYCGVIVRVRVCDAFNVSLCSSDVTVGSGGNYGGGVSVPLFGRVPLPSNSSLYTIFIVVDFPGNCIDRYATVYMDVIGSPSRFTVTLAPNGVETFAVSPVSEGTSYFMYQVPTETTCICTEWIYKGCYNSTHEYWTRTCYPVACAAEIRFALNESCAAVTTITPIGPSPIPGAPPGAGYTGGLFNLTGAAMDLNITGPALVGIAIIDRIFSLAGIATLITIAVGAALGYITKNGHVAAIAILLSIIFFTLAGFYPWWFGIVFIIIAGLIVTIMFKEAF